MGDNSFLKHFITEPVYLIPGEESVVAKLLPAEEKMVEAIAEVADTQPEPAKPEQDKGISELKFKGTNANRVLVIVNQPGEEFINSTDESFLSKILAAVKLNINDIAIANFSNGENLTKETILKFNATKYMIFEVNNSELFDDDLPPYQIINIENGKQVLNCSSLATIAGDATQKKLLWTALQKMFL